MFTCEEKEIRNREYSVLLIKQLEMNKQAWEKLQANGITDNDDFCLNFTFTAPNRTRGEAIINSIFQQTDYTAYMTEEAWCRKKRTVQGTTKPFKLSQEMVDQWTSDMVQFGLHHQCKFDGWWLWKYNNHARLSVSVECQRIGSIMKSEPGLIQRLAKIIKCKMKLTAVRLNKSDKLY